MEPALAILRRLPQLSANTSISVGLKFWRSRARSTGRHLSDPRRRRRQTRGDQVARYQFPRIQGPRHFQYRRSVPTFPCRHRGLDLTSGTVSRSFGHPGHGQFGSRKDCSGSANRPRARAGPAYLDSFVAFSVALGSIRWSSRSFVSQEQYTSTARSTPTSAYRR